jgi:hypothetical protein
MGVFSVNKIVSMSTLITTSIWCKKDETLLSMSALNISSKSERVIAA